MSRSFDIGQFQGGPLTCAVCPNLGLARQTKKFRPSDLARSIRAAKTAGLPVTRSEIAPDGTIRLFHDLKASENLFDVWKAGRDARRT